MCRAEAVVLALRTFGEARQAAAGTQGTDAVAPTGQNLVRIRLMAYVPDELVSRRVENVVQSDREVDYAETCTPVSAGDGHRVDRLGPQLVGNLLQVPCIYT